MVQVGLGGPAPQVRWGRSAADITVVGGSAGVDHDQSRTAQDSCFDTSRHADRASVNGADGR
jgi:hypothetical protein